MANLDGLTSRLVRVDTRKLRKVRWLVEQASKAVHSDGRMHVGDKKMVLGKLAGVKRELDGILQLEMFPQSALE